MSLYPNNVGIRTSHVDALLYLHEYQAAIDKLTEYELVPSKGEWIAQQWGRAYLGLHQYEQAIASFSELINRSSADPHYFVYLARALQQYGDIEGAIEILRKGLRAYPQNTGIRTSLGADLERQRADDEAIEILVPMFDSFPSNTRAALAIIRVYLRQGRRYEAEQIYRQAERNVTVEMQPFLITARAANSPRLGLNFCAPRSKRTRTLVACCSKHTFRLLRRQRTTLSAIV